jgi:hypothetical protein
MSERLKKEQESVERLKKSVAELQVARSASEAQHTDLAERYLLSGATGGAQEIGAWKLTKINK